MSKRYSGERAVVIGAGMGGLPATQVLADHFRGVVVLERDVLPADATPRPGVPQGKHPPIGHHMAIIQAAYHDPAIHKQLIEVLNLLKPVSALRALEVMQ